MHRAIAFLILVPLLGCRNVSLEKVTPEEWFQRSIRNVMTSDDVSEVTRTILRRRGLHEGYRQDPRAAIELLVAEIRETHARNLSVAIAELAYLANKRTAAIDRVAIGTTMRYSYAYLFDPKLEPAPSPIDAQYRWACDLYGAALADLVRAAKKDRVRDDQTGTVAWYGGSTRFTVDRKGLAWDLARFDELLVASDYRVTGLPLPDIRRGFGLPCILRRSWDREAAVAGAAAHEYRYLPPLLTYAATAIVRFPDEASVLDDEHEAATVQVFDPTVTTEVSIAGQEIPLEIDYTTPIAAAIAKLRPSFGVRALLRTEEFAKLGGLYMFQPYRKGRIPILLIHGLASDPYTWLPLYNDLLSNETIRKRCQFMFWFYPTGQPILYSASQLRASVKEVHDLLDPDDLDESDDWSVVCGHSMGGLLARTLVIDPKDALWNSVFRKKFDDVDFTSPEKEILRDAFFFESIPNIRRVVFFATPHRGSPQATSVGGRLTASLVRLPKKLANPVVREARRADPVIDVTRATSVHGLRPDNPVLVTAANLPIHPRVTYHSVIGDEHRAGATDGTDGFVPYWSSHLDGAASEVVLHSDHSVQAKPRATRETRRIILEHIAAYDAARAKAADN
ncbi:MAG: esterase/lipase family protein [Planctomycetota bacterium]